MKNNLTIKITPEPLFILQKLQKKGFEAYIVGGAVRDTLMDAQENGLEDNLKSNTYNLKASDYDFTTSATPKQIQKIFPENFYENDFGTVGVTRTHLHEQMGISPNQNEGSVLTDKKTDQKIIDLSSATKIHDSLKQGSSKSASTSTNTQFSIPIEEEVYEITTFRSDGEYKNHRKPEKVVWGKTLESDLSRRDFTINAMAIKISDDFLDSLDFKKIEKTIDITPDNFEIIDPHGGIVDLNSEIIRTVGNPNKRFNEDALRLLRAIRFSVQLNLQIDDETYESIIQNANLINHISWERIRDEFIKMIKSDYPKEAIEILDETGLLKIIMPELLEGKLVMQGGHHISDVWNHNIDALAECPSKDPIVRLATLLHDVAKPHTHKLINGKPTFYNHEVIGSRIAKDIAKRLRLSKDQIEKIFILVRYHMFHYQPENSDSSIRRFMRKVGLENIDDILDLREADRLGSGARKTSWRLEEMKQRMIEQLHQPFSIGDLKVNGNDLMTELGIKPGPEIGKILNQLFEKVLEEPELNTREKLVELAKNI
jgi:tRNA nucleotidyltransferase (CCA-adding enzyme)